VAPQLYHEGDRDTSLPVLGQFLWLFLIGQVNLLCVLLSDGKLLLY